MWEREVDEARDKRRTKRVFMCEMYRIRTYLFLRHAALRKINVTVKARPRGRSFFGIGIRTTVLPMSASLPLWKYRWAKCPAFCSDRFTCCSTTAPP